MLISINLRFDRFVGAGVPGEDVDVSFDLIFDPFREQVVTFAAFEFFDEGFFDAVVVGLRVTPAFSECSVGGGGVDCVADTRDGVLAGDRRGESWTSLKMCSIVDLVKSESEDSRIDASSVKTESLREESSLPFRMRPFRVISFNPV